MYSPLGPLAAGKRPRETQPAEPAEHIPGAKKLKRAPKKPGKRPQGAQPAAAAPAAAKAPRAAPPG